MFRSGALRLPATRHTLVRPAARNILLWSSRTSQASRFLLDPDQVGRILSAKELGRLSRFRFSLDRDLFAVAHVMKRLALADLLDRPPWTLRFVENAYGKPELEGSGPWFNLSHSGGMAVIAVRLSGPVGVDIEVVDRPTNIDGLASQILTKAERIEFSVCMPSERQPLLLRYWTVKEACVKALGLGLSEPFSTIDVRFEGSNGVTVRHFENAQIKCRRFTIDNEYIGAIAWLNQS